MACPIGLDIGMHFSSGFLYDDRLECLSDRNCRKLTPTAVSFKTSISGISIGQEAIDEQLDNPENTITHIKHFIGQKWDPNMRKLSERYPFKLVNHKNEAAVQIGEAMISSATIYQYLLKEFITRTKHIKSRGPSTTVITVPVYFDTKCRTAILEAAESANLKNVYLINETTAILLSAIHDNTIPHDEDDSFDEYIMVVNVSGSCIEVIIAHVTKHFCKVLAYSSDKSVGGEEITTKMMIFLKNTCLDIVPHAKFDKRTMCKLRLETERLKKELDYQTTAKFHLSDIFLPSAASFFVSDDYINEILIDDVDAFVKLSDNTLQEAGLSKVDIKTVLLTGTHSNIMDYSPTQYFDDQEIIRYNDRLFAAKGAALQAALLEGIQVFSKPFQVIDVKKEEVYLLSETRRQLLIPRYHPVPYCVKNVIKNPSVDCINLIINEYNSRRKDEECNSTHLAEVKLLAVNSQVVILEINCDVSGIVRAKQIFEDELEKICGDVIYT